MNSVLYAPQSGKYNTRLFFSTETTENLLVKEAEMTLFVFFQYRDIFYDLLDQIYSNQG